MRYNGCSLQVCKAVCHRDSQALVGLYVDAPCMAPYLIDRMLERLRQHSAMASRAYTAPIPLALACKFYCFDTNKEVSRERLRPHLLEHSTLVCSDGVHRLCTRVCDCALINDCQV